MEHIAKTSDITIPNISIYANGSIRFSRGVTEALHLGEGDTVSFYRDEINEGKWYLKRFNGNVELRRISRSALEGCHRTFAAAFLNSIGEGMTKVTCRVSTKPNDEGMYELESIL